MLKTKFSCLVLILALALGLGAPVGLAQEAEATQASAKEPERIAFFGVWDQAKAEAQSSGRPIFLLSAAPQCKNIPGIW